MWVLFYFFSLPELTNVADIGTVPPKVAVSFAATNAIIGEKETGSGPKSRRKSTNNGPRDSPVLNENPENGDGWISVGPKNHRKSFTNEEAYHHRKKFGETHRGERGSFSGSKNESGTKERKKSFAKERPKKLRAQSEAVTKDKDAFRALSKRNPEWANGSAIADTEPDTAFSTMNASTATEQFEAWKAKMKGTAHEETDLVSSLPPAPQQTLEIPLSNRFRRQSNHEDLIWGTRSSPQDAFSQRRPSQEGMPSVSKFRDIFNPSTPKAPSSPLANSFSANSPAFASSPPLVNSPSVNSVSAPMSIAHAQYSNSANSYLGTLGNSPNFNNGQLFYSSPLGNMASLPVGSPNLKTDLPYGSKPKFQSEYLKQITTFHTSQWSHKAYICHLTQHYIFAPTTWICAVYALLQLNLQWPLRFKKLYDTLSSKIHIQ